MEKTKRLVLIIAVALLLPAFACGLPGLTPPKTPTPTGTIFAKENQTPGAVPTEGTVDSEVSCLKAASGAGDIGLPCIIGGYSAHYDILQNPNDHENIVTDSLMHANISVWAASAGKLHGSAHLTYSLNSKLEDTQASTCQTQTEIVKPFDWDVELNGQYSMQPDGNVQFLIQATPVRGPGYFELFPDCPDVPTRQENGIIWNGVSGKLVNGEFRAHTDNTIPSDATGKFYTEILLWVVK